jgi:class 3 adenylate cyclase/tetratricopeptide (TPR) repeat protein
VAESRKTVTIVFADVTGSTALGEQTDPEAMRRIMERYFEEMRSVLEKHGGTVEKFIGDAVMAVFGIPQVHEDDALRAVRAAAEMRERLAALNEEFERERGITIAVRTGVNTGEVVAGDPSAGQAFATGDAVNLAARLEQAAEPGDILLGPVTHELVREAVRAESVEPLDLKGKTQAVKAWRLVDVLPGIPAFTRRLDAPFVGRADELARLYQAYETARDGSLCQLVTITGAPGVGKSRLVRELIKSVGNEARVVVGRCLSYGDGITYWPLAEIIREVAGSDTRGGLGELLVAEADAALATERLLAAIGATDEPARTEEIFWATRLLFERLAHERPLIAVVDDIHWAEPTLLDLIEYLVGFARAPVLVACTARPDLFDARPHWPRRSAVELEALDDDEATTLIDALITESRISPEVHEQIRERAEGNPLFVEQMLALAGENGSEDADVPPTIQALLAARLDRLPADERSVLVRGAVEGRLFHRGAVSALLPQEEQDQVPARLLSLTRKSFVRPDEALFRGDDAFRFVHVLLRDATYETAPKELRADLHARFAGWLDARASELDDMIGYHLEQAYRYRDALGERADELAREAAHRLAAAGRRALGRGDMMAAVKLLERASGLLPADDRSRLELAAPLAEALSQVGRFTEGTQVLADAEAAARRLGLERVDTLLRLRRYGFEFYLNPQIDVERTLLEARAAIERFPDDDGVLATAWERVQDVEWFRGHLTPARAAAQRAFEYTERLGDIRRQGEAQAIVGASAYYGDEPLEVCIEQAHTSIDWARAHGALAHEAMALYALGALMIEKGQTNEGRDARDRACKILDELGMPVAKARLTGSAGAHIGLRALERAEHLRQLRSSFTVLTAAGETGALSTVAGNLALALYGAGEYEEAERAAAVSKEAGSPEDVVTQVAWRAARAVLLARRGELEEAERLAREAVRRATASEFFESRAEAYLSLGEVLRLAGQPDDAREALQSALAVIERKGWALSANAVRAKLDELQSSGSPSQ